MSVSMESRDQDGCQQEVVPGGKYGCREYSLEMRLYQLIKKAECENLKADERDRIVKLIAEIETILDF